MVRTVFVRLPGSRWSYVHASATLVVHVRLLAHSMRSLYWHNIIVSPTVPLQSCGLIEVSCIMCCVRYAPDPRGLTR